jgi:hypothetical protein
MERSSSNPQPQVSKRFLGPDEMAHRGTVRPEQGHPQVGGTVVFAEGQWQAIRVQLEREGWNPSQIDLVRDQLRQGWPLAMAKQNVARISGQCPIRARTDH